MSSPTVELHNVTKRFGTVDALDDVSLQINRNEVFGLLGPNGAGKSTLLDLLIGFRAPTAGSIRVLQMNPQDSPRAIRRRVGILPDAVSVNPNWSGRRHLEYAIRAMGTEETPEEALERVDLRKAIDRCAGEYSKGMQQRLILSMSLVGDPDVLLLDEPSTGVDPEGMEVIRDVISRKRKKGVSVVFSSHRLGQVETVADRAGILVDGEIVETDGLSTFSDTYSVVRVQVDSPPSSLENITAIDGVSNARIRPNGVEVTCTDQAKKRAQDAIEETCGPIYNVTIRDTSLEADFLEIVQ